MTSSVGAAIGRRDRLDEHIRRVDIVSTIAEPPKAWRELRARFDQLLTFDAVPQREKLIAAVLNGDGDILELRALAMAEAAGSRGDVIGEVRTAVYPRFVQLYDEVAADNYAKVGNEFDANADEFSAAAKRCDPEADGDSIVGKPDPVRTGWLDCAKYAARLDRLVPVLCAAAELCGISTADDTALLPLLVDPSGCHRRRLWEAWKAEGARCGHWSALAALGARIRACDLEGFAPYRRPKPLQRKQFPVGGPDSKGIYRTTVIDPEDADYTPPEPPEPPEQQPEQPRKAMARNR